MVTDNPMGEGVQEERGAKVKNGGAVPVVGQKAGDLF
jgi:hypothetical protein